MVEEYDPVANLWSVKATVPTARYGLASSSVGGRVYFFGGDSGGTYVSAVEEYNHVTNTWRVATQMSTPRFELTSAAVDGGIYIIGGNPDGQPAASTVEAYIP